MIILSFRTYASTDGEGNSKLQWYAVVAIWFGIT